MTGLGRGAVEFHAPTVQPTYDPPLRNCPLCGSGDLHHFDRDHRGHTIDRCQACGIRFMNPQYADRWLEHFYSTYVPAAGHDHDRSWRARPEIRRAAKRAGLELLAAHGCCGHILMGGCGDGVELQVAHELGWVAEGQDVAPATTARVAERCGAVVHSMPLAELPLPDASFDAVFLDQVIEHPKDPAGMLRAAHRLLRPGGLLYLGQPNIGSLANGTKTLLGRLGLRGRRRGRHYASQHHIFYYTPRVLCGLLRHQFGFEVLAVRGSPKQRGFSWLRALVERAPFLDSSFVVLARKPG